MRENEPPRRPLFDPASLYNRMRKSARPEHKMRGYFHWQKARAIRLGLARAEREPENEERRESELHGLACRLSSGHEDHKTDGIVPDFRVTDALPVRPVCLLGAACFRAAIREGALVLVREADGSRTVGMLVTLAGETAVGLMPPRDQPVSCRAFLIEPEVLARIQEVVRSASDIGADEALDHAFAADTIASNTDIARLLAAIPDLDGEVRDGLEFRFRRLPLADEFDIFPPRQRPLTVVLVCDERGPIPDR